MKHQVRVSDRISSRFLSLAEDDLGDKVRRSAEQGLRQLRMPNVTMTLGQHVTTPFQRIWIKTSDSITHEDWPEVIKGLRQLIELNPPRLVLVNTWVLMGIACFRAGELADAEKAFEDALALDPDNPLANLFLGSVRMLSNDFDRAVGPFEKTRASDKSDTHVNFYLGYVYSELHRWDDAIAMRKLTLVEDQKLTNT
jgi:cytochrome c-type biogenesis protein CcmH/NrfG